MNTTKFSQSVRDVIGFSREEALRLGNDAIAPEHLLLGILRERDSNAYIQLSKLNIDLMRVKRTIESRVSRSDSASITPDLPLTKSTERVLKIVFLEARSLELRGHKSEVIDTEHLLLAILKEENNLAASVLNEEGLEWSQLQDAIAGYTMPQAGAGFTDDDAEDEHDDEDGKEIFENDVIEWEYMEGDDFHGHVIFKDGYFYARWDDGTKERVCDIYWECGAITSMVPFGEES